MQQRSIRFYTLAFCLLVLGGLITLPLQANDETTLLNLTNQARIAAGAPALRLDSQLTQAAQAHSNDMAARNVLSHVGGDGSTLGDRVTRTGYTWQAVGENVLYRFDLSAQGAFDQWWNSSGHRTNMLNATYCDIGLAHARSSSGRYYYTMVLARRRGTTSCTAVPTATRTLIPPTATPTPRPPTATPRPPTATPRPPTATATATVQPPTATPVVSASLQGVVRLQGRASAAQQVVTVQLTPAGGAALTQSVTLAADGGFTISNLQPGVYSVRIKHAQYLAVTQSITLVNGINPVTFPELPAGDVNNDNQVTLVDFGLLAVTFNRREGEAGYDGRGDLNADRTVTLADFALLAANFNRQA